MCSECESSVWVSKLTVIKEKVHSWMTSKISNTSTPVVNYDSHFSSESAKHDLLEYQTGHQDGHRKDDRW